MELVYLWVEDYKNIQTQGFNFSPRFECEYDAEKKELTINENKNHLKNFFGENINVTAIVGENGSGKSSVLKLILMLIFSKKYKNTAEHKDKVIMLEQELKSKALFLIILTGSGYKKISLNISINSQEKLIELDNTNIDFYSIYFSYMLDTLQNKDDYWMWNLYHKSDAYKTPILLTPNKFHKDLLDNSINLDNIEYINIKHSIKFYKKEIDVKINKFFTPNRIKLYTDNPSTIDNVEYDFFRKVGEKFLNLSSKYKFPYNKEHTNIILKSIKLIETNREYEKINLLYIAFKILSSPRDNFNADVYQKIDEWFKTYLDTSFIKRGIQLVKDNISNIFKNEIIKYNNEKINDCIEFHNNSSNQKNKILNKLLDREIVKLVDFQDISIILVPWIDLELLQDNKSFNSLSGGQKLFFTFIINMMYEVSNLIDEVDYKTINLFFDEVETGYHPNWQKEFVYNILEALKNINFKNKKINILFATHSPFIISDLPKNNVMFLKGGDQVDVDINPFGANIHTLLSHGFFMEDGLMGEFAKNKIDKAIKYLNQKSLQEEEIDYCEDIISIIGEPIIKNQLQRMLDSKRLSKVDKIDKLEEELELIKHRIEIMRKNQ